MHNITGRALPTVAAIHAEVARTEAMIIAATQEMETSQDPRKAMNLHVCRAELHAYLAGLLYSLGQTNSMESQTEREDATLIDFQANLQDVSGDDDAPRFMECFEC